MLGIKHIYVLNYDTFKSINIVCDTFKNLLEQTMTMHSNMDKAP